MSKTKAGEVVIISTKGEFDAFLKDAGSKLVVVDFFALWCGPCKAIKPEFKRLAEEFKEKAFFATVDVDESDDLAEEHGITAMPTFMFFKDSIKVDDNLLGGDKKKLRAKIEANI